MGEVLAGAAGSAASRPLRPAAILALCRGAQMPADGADAVKLDEHFVGAQLVRGRTGPVSHDRH